jgi:pimeloyl-ACP methyl ester carboxylesterase
VRYEIEDLVCDYTPVQYSEPSQFTEVYGFAGSQGTVSLDGMLFRPKAPSKTLVLMMHPSTAIHFLPVPNALARLGYHVLCAHNRYSRNDTALIFEKVLLDYGAFVRHAREVLGYEKIVLHGWSGGGPLTTFYQSQAENPTIEATPAGDPLDIRAAGLLPGDAVIFHAASVSRARILLEALDPSLRDEADPENRIPELDLYDPANPNQPPYGRDFLGQYRQAQRARMTQITEHVKDQLETIRKKGTGEVERCFVTHRTMADPRSLDTSMDHNDRLANRCVSGVPETVNSGPVGFARFSTLRSWLSQWSLDDSRADAAVAVKLISTPLLAIENSADEAAPVSHMHEVFAASASADKSYHVIKGADHYYRGTPDLLAEATSIIDNWLTERGCGVE